MERKRVAGRFACEVLGSAEDGVIEEKDAAVETRKLKTRRTSTRKQLVQALPEIAEKLLEEAKKGSVQHTKLLIKLGGLEGARC